MLYSHSRLKCFEQCPLKFKFAYIDKLEGPSEEGVEAFLGSRVHETLEKLYKDLRFMKENTLQELLDYFNSQWKKNWNGNIIIVKKEYTSENYRKLGVKYVTDYYNVQLKGGWLQCSHGRVASPMPSKRCFSG